MDKIVLDTNVVVSALISKNSPPARILDELVLSKKVELCLSDEVLAEYIEVLRREKFSRFPEFGTRATVLLNRLNEISTKFSPITKLGIIKDEHDNRLLELAIAAGADFLITGNSNDFTFQAIGRTRILSPRAFCDGFWPV